MKGEKWKIGLIVLLILTATLTTIASVNLVKAAIHDVEVADVGAFILYIKEGGSTNGYIYQFTTWKMFAYIKNNGDFDETFNITYYLGNFSKDFENVFLTAHNFTVITFNYTFTQSPGDAVVPVASIPPLQNESNTTNNMKIGWPIIISKPNPKVWMIRDKVSINDYSVTWKIYFDDDFTNLDIGKSNISWAPGWHITQTYFHSPYFPYTCDFDKEELIESWGGPSGYIYCHVNAYDKADLNNPENSSFHLTVSKYVDLRRSVGGFIIPVDKFALLAPYIGLTSTIIVAAVATVIYVKRVKRRKEKQ
jgi:uncharacterized MnhB-related membrane protein